jgi:hypothetical protein
MDHGDKDWLVFTPEYNDNAKLEKPMTCEVHALLHGEVKEYADITTFERTKSGKVDTNVQEVERKKFIENVRNVKNCTIRNRTIDNAVDLWTYGEPDLVQEIVDAMDNFSVLDKNEKKFYKSGLTSKPVVTQIGSAKGA